jgi:uncharacterized protein DUF4326
VKPIRIQRKRSKGWRMPPNTIYVGRPTKWGNPYVNESPAKLKALFAAMWEARVKYFPKHNRHMQGLEQLRGKNLACWCPLDQPCHADVLLEIANSDSSSAN